MHLGLQALKFVALIILAVMFSAALGYEIKADCLILMSITIAFLKAHRIGHWVYTLLAVTATFYIPVSWNYGHPNLTIISSLMRPTLQKRLSSLMTWSSKRWQSRHFSLQRPFICSNGYHNLKVVKHQYSV